LTNNRKGAFIVLEGIDASGKTIQAEMLYKYFRKNNYPTVLTKEPTDGILGKIVREHLAGKIMLEPQTLALLFAADRVEHVQKKISPELERGKIVISDRYYYSSFAYQRILNLELSWLKDINRYAIKPDLVFYIDITPEESIRRMEAEGSLRKHMQQREIFEKKELQKKVRDFYLSFPHLEKINGLYTNVTILKEKEKDLRVRYLSLVNEEDLIFIDGSRKIEEIQKEIQEITKKRLARKLGTKRLEHYGIEFKNLNLDQFKK
jgi:dTMP kinase